MRPAHAAVLAAALATTAITVAQTTATHDLFGLNNRHDDPGSAVHSGNVKSLKLAWQVNINNPVSHAPLLHDGRVYFADWGGGVYAIDAKTGAVAWKQAGLEKVKKDWPWHGFAGTGAIGDGKLFEASVEGTAFALDARTGKVLWKTDIAPDNEYAGSLATSLYHNGVVYFGLQSVEEPMTAMKEGFKPSFQGKVMALDANTGRVVWRKQLVESPRNGVPVWQSFALDPETNTLFFATGNNYTGEPSETSDAVFAEPAARSGRLARERRGRDVVARGGPARALRQRRQRIRRLRIQARPVSPTGTGIHKGRGPRW